MDTSPAGPEQRSAARWGVRGLGMLIGLSGLLLVGFAAKMGWDAALERTPTDLVRALFVAVLAAYPLWIGVKAFRGSSLRLTKHVCVVVALLLGGALYSPLQNVGARLPIASNILEDVVVILAACAVVLLVYAILLRGIQALAGGR